MSHRCWQGEADVSYPLDVVTVVIAEAVRHAGLHTHVDTCEEFRAANALDPDLFARSPSPNLVEGCRCG